MKYSCTSNGGEHSPSACLPSIPFMLCTFNHHHIVFWVVTASRLPLEVVGCWIPQPFCSLCNFFTRGIRAHVTTIHLLCCFWSSSIWSRIYAVLFCNSYLNIAVLDQESAVILEIVFIFLTGSLLFAFAYLSYYSLGQTIFSDLISWVLPTQINLHDIGGSVAVNYFHVSSLCSSL